MQREIHFMGHLPEFYRDIYEFKAIGGSEDAEFQTLGRVTPRICATRLS